MKEGKISAAENVYRRDLQDYPRNGWSLFGLSLALEAQGKTEEAEEVNKKLSDSSIYFFNIFNTIYSY